MYSFPRPVHRSTTPNIPLCSSSRRRSPATSPSQAAKPVCLRNKATKIEGNYSICAENLNRATKTLTLNYNVVKETQPSAKLSQIEALDGRIQALYLALSDISSNIGKLRTRETVHFESKLFLG